MFGFSRWKLSVSVWKSVDVESPQAANESVTGSVLSSQTAEAPAVVSDPPVLHPVRARVAAAKTAERVMRDRFIAVCLL